MISSIVRLCSLTACALVVLGFAMFAADEARSGSDTQLQRLESGSAGDAGGGGESAREGRHGPVREAVEDANDVLLDPFTGVVDSSSEWVARGVPTLLALTVYGFLLGMLARYLATLRMPRSGVADGA